jgi:hypothetical protein
MRDFGNPADRVNTLSVVVSVLSFARGKEDESIAGGCPQAPTTVGFLPLDFPDSDL